MAEEVKQLFADDGTVPVQPSIVIHLDNAMVDPGSVESGIVKGVDLISRGVEEAIGGEFVKALMIPEDLDITVPNYVLDFRKAKRLRKHQIDALASLINDEGDTSIYVYLSSGIVKLGMGVGTSLDRVLPAGIQSIFGDDCLLYQDVEHNKPVRELKQQDVNKVRLRL